MNCESPEDIEKSEKLFMQARTYTQFLDLWSKFYTNEICIPTYLDNFVGGEDNPQATNEMGRKFQRIVGLGVIPIDFQTTIPGHQKGYVDALCPKDLAGPICEYINRYPGFVAFYKPIDEEIKYLYVTYEDTEEKLKEYARMGVMLGTPYSHVGSPITEPLEFVHDWLSPDLSYVINDRNFVQLIIIDTTFTGPDDKILNVLVNALSDNSNLSGRVIYDLNRL